MLALLLALSTHPAMLAEDLPEGWGKFAAPSEGFAVTLPNGHKRQHLTDKDPDGGEVKITLYRATSNDGMVYVVGVSEFGKEYMRKPNKEIYDNARNRSVARSGGKLLREKDLKIGKLDGREIITAAGKNAGFVRARVVVAHNHQYSAMVAGKTEAAVESDDALRFLDSFRIIPLRKPKGKI